MKELLKLRTWIIGLKFFFKLVILVVYGLIIRVILNLIIEILPETMLGVIAFSIFGGGLLYSLLIIYVFIKHGIFRVPYPNGDEFDLSKEYSIFMIITMIYAGVILGSVILELFFNFDRLLSGSDVIYLTAIWLFSAVLFGYFDKIDLLKE